MGELRWRGQGNARHARTVTDKFGLRYAPEFEHLLPRASRAAAHRPIIALQHVPLVRIQFGKALKELLFLMFIKGNDVV